MAVSTNGRARGRERVGESIVLVGFHFSWAETPPAPDGKALGGALLEQAAGPPELPPRYYRPSRQLWYDGALLTKIQRPDSNQAKILLAFDEEGWPERVYDPLPPKGEIDPRKRLQDTLYALNRSIERKAKPGARCLVKFHVEEDGTAIRWERVEAAETTPAQASPRVWRPERAIRRTEQLPRRCK